MKIASYNRDLNSERFIIPVKISDYNDIFNPFDNSPLENRKVNSELTEYLKDTLLKVTNFKAEDFELKITLPISKKSKLLEYDTLKGITNFYKSFNTSEKLLRKTNIKRIVYFLLGAIIFEVLWLYVKKQASNAFYAEIFLIGSVLLLWQVMVIIFIESKAFIYNRIIYQKLSTLHVSFNYEKRED